MTALTGKGAGSPWWRNVWKLPGICEELLDPWSQVRYVLLVPQVFGRRLAGVVCPAKCAFSQWRGVTCGRRWIEMTRPQSFTCELVLWPVEVRRQAAAVAACFQEEGLSAE